MAYFSSLWQARIIEKYRLEYENEKFNSLLISNTEIPRKTMMQRWRIYGHYTKRRMTGRLKKWFPDGSSVSNLYYYLKTDQTFPNFVMKSIIGFLGGIVLTYLCFMFFVFQLSISLIHATFMSSIIGVLLTLGLAFSFRIRCLVFLLIPQFFSRIGRYTLMCYALVLILTGPATNTLKNSEVLSESMACSQEQIKSSARQITESMKTPFNSMKDSIKIMVDKIKRVASKLNHFVSKIGILTTSIGDEIQSSLNWLISVVNICNRKLGTPYDYCMNAANKGLENCKESWICNASSVKSACLSVKTYDSICVVADYATTSFAATLKRKLKTFTKRISEEFFMDIEMHHSHSFSSNESVTANQVAAGIVTEMRNRADPLLTWLSWSSCVTSLFLLLIIFRAKYYQQMYETRSRFDNRYVTKELRELDLKRYQEGRETVLPLNRRERAKYISIMSYRLIGTEKVYLTRSIVFMTITTFKLLIHMVADYSLYWVLMTIRYHGRFQSQIPPGSSDPAVFISGSGFVQKMIQSIFDSMTIPSLFQIPSPVTCLPNPYPPDLKRYMQIAVLITLLWFFALFEPYGLRLRHVIMGHYRPERAKSRAMWLYNHILRTRGSFMKLARRKLHREYKYSVQKDMTFRHLINSYIPWWCLKYILGSIPNEPHCLLCNTFEDIKDGDTKLKSCETLRCPGIYCLSCFSDIGKLCTICLSPADYGDMSDVSLEKGSSDESTDDENDNINLKPFKNNDNERTKLIKKSTAPRKYKIQKQNKEGGQYEACNTISNDDKTYEDPTDNIIKTNISTKMSDANLKTYDCLVHKIFQMKEKKKEKKGLKKEKKGLKKDSKSEYCKLRSKLKNLNMLKWKYKIRTDKKGSRRSFYRIFDSFSQYSGRFNGYKFSSSVYNIQKSTKSIKVYKTTHTTLLSTNILLKEWKHLKRSNKLLNNKNVYKRPCLNLLYSKKTKPSNPKINQFSLTKNPNNLKNVIDNSSNKENIKNDKIKKRKNKKSSDKVPKKEKNKVKKKQCCHRVKKIGNLCSSCLLTMKRQMTPSKELLHNFKKKNCPYSSNKSNFKRRKKEKQNDNENSNKATLDSENTRNYRISTYLLDNCWIKGKFGKDPKTDQLYKDKALNDLALLRIEAVNQQEKEKKILKVIKKMQLKAATCFCPITDCICKEKTENDPEEPKKEGYIFNPNVDEPCQNIVGAEKIIDPSIKIKTSRSSKGMKIDFDKISTSLKSFKIKEVRLGISERFLHLRIRNPLPVMRDLYASLVEASKKDKRYSKDKPKFTDEKGITVLPAVMTRSCQCIQELKNVKQIEDRTTQVKKKKKPKKLTKTVTPKLICDVDTDVIKPTCTCATQYHMKEDKSCSCMEINKFVNTTNVDKDSTVLREELTESTVSLYSFSEGTKTDTTICSRVEINYEEQRGVKNKTKRKINAITKANQSTTTDKANLCDVSTITNDWWSPIVDRKPAYNHLYRETNRKRRNTNDRSVSTDGRIVTFKSRPQIIPTDTTDILSPSRYLLESQRYYNELFSSGKYSPRAYPALFYKKSKHRGKHISSRDSISSIRKDNRNRNGYKPKRLDKRVSSSFKARIEKTRSDESNLLKY